VDRWYSSINMIVFYNYKKGKVMKQKKIAVAAAVLLGLSTMGCNSITVFNSGSGEEFIYKNISFGHDRDRAYKSGVMDGCRTSSGKYTKNHASFKSNDSYRVGWESGRLKCKGEE